MEKRDLRIVFMGTPDFAVKSLKVLVEANYNIVGVVTMPDKPAGRGRKIVQSPVKQYAVAQGLTVLQPEKLKAPDFVGALKALQANLQVVVAFRMLPEIVWDMPEYGTFNLHGSLLPQYRGAAPINWAVMNGDTKTGVTTFFIQHEIDTGNIVFREETPIGADESVGDVHDRLMAIGGQLVLKTVKAIEADDYQTSRQEHLLANGETMRPAPKIFKDDCKVNWEWSIEKCRNFVRGLSPYPAAWSEIEKEGKTLNFKIYKVHVVAEPHGLACGTLVCDGKQELKIAVSDGFVFVDELQLAGKKRLPVTDLLRGFSFDGSTVKS